MAREAPNQKNANSGKSALIICIVVILVLAGVIVWLLLRGKEDETPQRNVVVNEENAESIASEMMAQEKTPIGSYEVTMNATWNFKNGTATSDNAFVKNAESNTNSVYFDVVRSDTEDTIYASPILPVGTYLENIALDEELPAGTYDCVCTYHLLDEESNPVGRVNVSLQIVIQN